MYLISQPVICVDCESWDLQVIKDRTKKGGLGKTKMNMRSLKRGATGRMSQPKLKKTKKTAHLNRLVRQKQSTNGNFLCICLCFFTLRNISGSSSMHRTGILGSKDKVSAHA